MLCVITQLVASFPLWQHRFSSKSSHVGYAEDNVMLQQVFSDYFSFPY
jgi:hypothetical protein